MEGDLDAQSRGNASLPRERHRDQLSQDPFQISGKGPGVHGRTMRVHVTGAGGFIGGALVPELRRAGHDIVAPDAAQAIVHLAGIAHRRASRRELADVNVGLTERIARQAAATGARFLFMSSVKVHGEHSHAALTEASPIAPQDAYAESKAVAEERLRAIAGLRLALLRPPLVHGP